MKDRTPRSNRRPIVGLFVVGVLLLAACTSNGDTSDTSGATESTGAGTATTAATATTAPTGTTEPSSGVPQDPDAELLVWVDATRQATAEAYAEMNPDQAIKIELITTSDLIGKIQLANRAGSGLPDVVFAEPESIAAFRTEQFGEYAADITPYLEDGLVEAYGEGLAVCERDGIIDCLRNDLAQTVLWYNSALMEQFGYDVPTTMTEFQALGATVAAEHPGYSLGAVGDQFIWFDFFWSSGCPLADVIDDAAVHINALAPECTRVADVLDPMIANGSISTLSTFDPAYIEIGNQNKILMSIQPSWFGEFMFKPTFLTPEGELAVAETPRWSESDPFWAGNGGGGIYVVARLSQNIQGAVDMATWMATSLDVQVLAPTYPAYGPAAVAWGEAVSNDSFYAEDPFPVLQTAAGKINPVAKPTRYKVQDAIFDIVVASIQDGGTIAESLEPLQAALTNAATTTGYAVLVE